MKALEYLLNFRTNKATFRDATGDVKTLKESFVGLGKTVTDIKDKISKFSSSQKWANITSMASTAMGSISSIAGNIKGAFTSFYGFVDGFASEGDKLAKTSRVIGLSVKDYQAFQFAAERCGISVESLDTSLNRFNINMAKAKAGDKTAAKMFDSLLPKSINEYKTGKEVILDLADAYSNLDHQQQAFVSQNIFGKSGLQMTEMFSGRSKGLAGLLDQFEELGGGYTDEMAKNSESFKDDLTNMQVTFKAMKATVAGALLPAFSKIFKTITTFFTHNREMISKTVNDIAVKLVRGIEELIPKIPDILDGTMKIFGFVGSIFEKLDPVNTLIAGGILVSLKDIVPLLTSISGGIGTKLVPAIGLATVGFEAWKSVFVSIDKNMDMLKNTSLKELARALLETAKEVINDINKMLNNAFPNIMKFIGDKMKATPFVGKVDFADNPDVEELVKSMTNKPAAGSKNTSRFVVDFKNMPQGVKVTPPPSGDFDYSYGYIFNPN